MKNIITIVLFALVVVSGFVYFKYYHPQSQLQLKTAFSSIISPSIEKYYNSQAGDCGIWYYHHEEGNEVKGRSNSSVENCFRKAQKRCVPKKVLVVDDKSKMEESSITYSSLEILRDNDAGECLFQNYHEEQFFYLDRQVEPLFYINTCTTLAEDMKDSCEPRYITDKKNQ